MTCSPYSGEEHWIYRGNLHPFMSHLFLLQVLVVGAPGCQHNRKLNMADTKRGVSIEPIVGRYAHIDMMGASHRIYFEQAGSGIDLLCLHTAGSDGRQYRALLNDPEVLSQYRVTVFDMPWHGKSSPPAGWHEQEYRLTSDELHRTGARR